MEKEIKLKQKNINFAKNLFKRFKATKDEQERFLIIDYFSVLVLTLLENKKKEFIEKYIPMFKEFEKKCSESKTIKNWELYFFSLINLLENKLYFLNNDEDIKIYLDNVKEILKDGLVNYNNQ